MRITGAFLALLSLSAMADILTYTETESGPDLIPLGFPVPHPVDSLTPIDGFRTYQSLNLRHSQLAELSGNITQIQIGQTLEDRPIWAYTLSDADSLTENGAKEGVALINGGIHAREWQSPEVLTGYLEMLFEREDDEYLAQYVLENMHIMLIPVLNIDGFIQTQRFPARVTNSEETPRDGRMRRKNMRDADTQLATQFNNLNGVDLNRNNNPFWATSTGSSDDARSLVYHGQMPASEPETSALQQAAVEAGEDRLRFYTDTHSFSQIYLASRTGNPRRNTITRKLATVMRAANNFKYDFAQAGSGTGIGTTEEYFTQTYDIPSYTLELEPKNSARDYGAIAGGHSGFILPETEVARMRSENNQALLAGLYAITAVPYLKRLEVWQITTNQPVITLEWQYAGSSGTLTTVHENPLQGGTDYEFRLVFNKPMRWLEDNQPANFASLSNALDINLVLVGEADDEGTNWILDTTFGEWLTDSDYARYKTDTFALPVTLDASFDWASLDYLALEVDTHDFSGQQLDTNPATRSDWSSGAWVNYEDTQGQTGDMGGTDRSMRLIDDGRALYPAPTPPPTPPPAPPPANRLDASSGGSMTWWILGLLLIGASYRGHIKGVPAWQTTRPFQGR